MDRHTPEQRRKNMKAVKSKDSRIELLMRKELWNKGYRYRKHYNKIIGRPDIVFPKYKIAIFCDGEFWHGHNWNKTKKGINTNRDFWFEKIEGNIKRDREVDRILGEEGWLVLRFWESDILKRLNDCIAIVEKNINERVGRKW
tara:strand:+ start:16 stop:444 length:429 start_codon:yes stop_codon:yes gene_type:complete